MSAGLSTFDPGEFARDPADPRDAYIAGLLDADPGRRREALAVARARRWVDVYGEVTVRAVVVDGPDARRRRLAHALAVTGRTHTLVVEDGETLVLVTSVGRTERDVEEWVATTAMSAGVALAAPIGCAELAADDEDLQRAFDDARATTELLMLVGRDVLGTARAADLGLWRLLHGMSGSRRLIAAASPAADELWRSADPTRRETVEVFLDAGCSVAVACRALFIHRTTLYYRLENMSDTVRAALDDGLQRSALHLALKLLRLWEGADDNSSDGVSGPGQSQATITPLRPRQVSKRTSGRLI
jgi:sugar diacid utilization regulator